MVWYYLLEEREMGLMVPGIIKTTQARRGNVRLAGETTFWPLGEEKWSGGAFLPREHKSWSRRD